MNGSVKILWVLGWLLLWTWWDLRYREISLWQIVLVLSAGVVWQLSENALFHAGTVGGAMLGVAACGFSMATRDQFGMGDAMVILCVGLYHGGSVGLAVLMWGLLFASGISVYLLLCRHYARQQALPLVPCIAAGYVLMLISGNI